MPLIDIRDLRVHIIWKLFHRGCFGKISKYGNTVLSGIPANLRYEAKKQLEKLVKEGVIIEKPHKFGIKYYLNIKNKNIWINEIEKVKSLY